MGKLNEDVLANMERYKGVVDKEGKKLGIESKYELECTRPTFSHRATQCQM